MNITILGGGYAGVLAAQRLAHRSRGNRITLIDQRDGLVERIRLHQIAAGDDVAAVPYRRLFRGLNVTVMQARVTAIDRDRKRVVLADGEDVPYDRLVYALGSSIDVDSVPGVREHAFALAGPEASRALAERLRHLENASVLICGGGLTGIELAAEIAERFPSLRVIIATSDRIGACDSAAAEKHLRGWFESHHVELIENLRITRLEPRRAITSTGESIQADAIVWCGAFTASPLAAAAGLATNARGQLVVDPFLRTSDPSIYAVGDAAGVDGLRMGCVTAMPMGAYVADVIGGTTDEPFRFAFGGTCISLGRHDGVFQLTHADDTPRPSAIVGRAGAWVKELICRYTVLALRLQRVGIHYRWPKTGEPAVRTDKLIEIA